MPENLSSNKVRVTRLFGAGATVGFVDPKVHMQVRHHNDARWIVSLDSGNFQVGLAVASGGTVTSKAYPHDLACSTGVASYFGWPAGAGGTAFGHTDDTVQGTEVPNSMTILRGNGAPYTFTR